MAVEIEFNEKRAEEVGLRLGSHPGLPQIFMEADPQYQAVKDILENLGLVEGMLYVVGIALISYMLTTRGEEHWRTAARYSKLGFPRGLIEFVEKSNSTALYRRAKRKRLEKYLKHASPSLKPLIEKKANPDAIVKRLSSLLDARGESKTITFAAKMAYYVYSAAGIRVEPPSTPMPVDYRVCLVTVTSGIARTGIPPRKAARILRSSYTRRVRETWSRVSSSARIKPVLLDNIVWLAGRCIDENLDDPGGISACLQRRVPSSKRYLDALRELWLALTRPPIKD